MSVYYIKYHRAVEGVEVIEVTVDADNEEDAMTKWVSEDFKSRLVLKQDLDHDHTYDQITDFKKVG